MFSTLSVISGSFWKIIFYTSYRNNNSEQFGIMAEFLRTSTVRDNVLNVIESRWPAEVVIDVQKYVKAHPTFYIEELQKHLRSEFPYLKNTSDSTICRALNFDLQLTRKKLTKATREAASEEVKNYFEKLKVIYSFPEQLIFIEETSKDGGDVIRQ